MITVDANKKMITTSKYEVNEIVKVKLNKEEMSDEPCWLQRGLISASEVIKHDFKIKGRTSKGEINMYRIEKNNCIIDNVPEENLEKSDSKVEHPRHIEQFIKKEEVTTQPSVENNNKTELPLENEKISVINPFDSGTTSSEGVKHPRLDNNITPPTTDKLKKMLLRHQKSPLQ